MKRCWGRSSIKARLMLWYSTVLMIVLAINGIVIFVMILAFPLAAGFAGIGGYILAGRVLAPIDRIIERARTISAEHLSERLPVDNPDDELGQLASVLNDTFSRLDRSFKELRRFSSDASHELRTPLTAIRSVGELGFYAPPAMKGLTGT